MSWHKSSRADFPGDHMAGEPIPPNVTLQALILVPFVTVGLLEILRRIERASEFVKNNFHRGFGPVHDDEVWFQVGDDDVWWESHPIDVKARQVGIDIDVVLET